MHKNPCEEYNAIGYWNIPGRFLRGREFGITIKEEENVNCKEKCF